MKKEINITINKVLGQFWTKWFKDTSMVDYLRTLLGGIYQWSDEYVHDAINTKLINKDIDGITSVEYVLVPADVCLSNTLSIKEVHTFDNAPIQHLSAVRYIQIPSKYIMGNTIVDSVVKPASTWIIGINALRTSEYVRLYLPNNYSLPCVVRGSNSVPTAHYPLYVYVKKSPISHSQEFGVILGQYIGKLSLFMRQLCWRMYNQGTSSLNIKQSVSQCVGNDVCLADDYYKTSWREGDRYYVSTVNSLYHGTASPLTFASGKLIHAGDQLFDDGKLIYNDIPADILELPLISVSSGDEIVHLQNITQSTVPIAGGVTIPVLASDNYYTKLNRFIQDNNLEAPMSLSVAYVNPVHTYMHAIRRDTYMVGIIKDYTKLDETTTDILLDVCKKSMYKGAELSVLAHTQKLQGSVTPLGNSGINYLSGSSKLHVKFPKATIKTLYL